MHSYRKIGKKYVKLSKNGEITIYHYDTNTIHSFTIAIYLPAVMGGQLSAPASDIGYDILAARPLLSAEFIDMYAASEGWGA